jgi:hypothetical protein
MNGDDMGRGMLSPNSGVEELLPQVGHVSLVGLPQFATLLRT